MPAAALEELWRANCQRSVLLSELDPKEGRGREKYVREVVKDATRKTFGLNTHPPEKAKEKRGKN